MADVKDTIKPEERLPAPGPSQGKGVTANGGAPMKPPSDPVLDLDIAAKWGYKTLDQLKGLGKRIFVHIVAVACAAAIAVSAGSVLAGICAYAGIICIVARGIAMTPAWLVPALAGAIQAAVLVLFDVPFPQALFWGGAQSWLQRLLQKRLGMGSEWGMLLLILPLGIYLLTSAPLLILFGSFAALGLAGAVVSRGFAFREQALARAEEIRKKGPPEPDKVAAYRASLADFRRKIESLPANAHPLAVAIADSTANILDCMAKDTRDLEPGHRFLNRYFKAAHSVVDKHVSLAREKVITGEIAEALEKSREMLARLDDVFAKEHGKLLENNVTDFSADLAVLDTLLKMDGK